MFGQKQEIKKTKNKSANLQIVVKGKKSVEKWQETCLYKDHVELSNVNLFFLLIQKKTYLIKAPLKWLIYKHNELNVTYLNNRCIWRSLDNETDNILFYTCKQMSISVNQHLPKDKSGDCDCIQEWFILNKVSSTTGLIFSTFPSDTSSHFLNHILNILSCRSLLATIPLLMLWHQCGCVTDSLCQKSLVSCAKLESNLSTVKILVILLRY